MKKETKEIIINHPALGVLKKKMTFTYDDTKYSSLDECIVDHEAMMREQKVESDKITAENKAAIDSANAKHELDINSFQKAKEELKVEYQKKMKDLEESKPVFVQPELKKVDGTKYAGRGYVSKEIFTEEVKPKTLLEQLAGASEQEKQAIRDLLK